MDCPYAMLESISCHPEVRQLAFWNLLLPENEKSPQTRSASGDIPRRHFEQVCTHLTYRDNHPGLEEAHMLLGDRTMAERIPCLLNRSPSHPRRVYGCALCGFVSPF